MVCSPTRIGLLFFESSMVDVDAVIHIAGVEYSESIVRADRIKGRWKWIPVWPVNVPKFS